MDPHRFDYLARALGSAPATRRHLFRGTLAGGGAGLAALLGLDRGRLSPRSAAAVDGGTCRVAFAADPGSITSKNACGATPCGTAPGCYCVQTVGHVPRCLVGFDPTLGRDHCPAKDRCDAHRDCRSGLFCAKVEGCCGRTRNACLRACPA